MTDDEKYEIWVKKQRQIFRTAHNNLIQLIRKIKLDKEEEIWDEENGKYKAHTIILGEPNILENFEIPVKYC